MFPIIVEQGDCRFERGDCSDVGGGEIAGSTLAGVLARSGLGVLVVDKEARFRDRVRGESTYPWGVAEALRAGLGDLLKQAGSVELSAFQNYKDRRLASTYVLATDSIDGLSEIGFSHPRLQEEAFTRLGRSFTSHAGCWNDEFVMRIGVAESMLVALPRNRMPPGRRVAPVRVADLEIDALDQRIHQGTREIRLSPNEHFLLYTLASRASVVVSYRELTDALGRNDPAVRNNTLARHVSSLRRKLRDDPDRPRYIETVRTIGFRFIAAPRTPHDSTP